MPIHHSLWRVASKPQPLREAILPSEALLEGMIVASPEILSREWMIIGRQEDTGFGGRIDLLALAPDGALILIELKRGRTPREVVAQAIDYASWAERLPAEDIARIYARFSGGGSLDAAFAARFGTALDAETLNQSHQIVIVAASLDAASERIVGYLNRRDIPINVLCSRFSIPEASNFSAAHGCLIQSKRRRQLRRAAQRRSRNPGMVNTMLHSATARAGTGERRENMDLSARVAAAGTAARWACFRLVIFSGSRLLATGLLVLAECEAAPYQPLISPSSAITA